MAYLSDLTTPLSGLNHIDALLQSGPWWNYQTGTVNTISYTFSTASGLQTFTSERPASFSGSVAMLSAAQQAGVRIAMDYLSSVTGIIFKETSDGAAASLHLYNVDLIDPGTAGQFRGTSSYGHRTDTNEITSYKVNGYIYLDNAEWAAYNSRLDEGGRGYEILLHELGHALGLKHPFDGDIQLPDNDDHTANTLMSYDSKGGPYADFSPYDLAALNWLYGGDGLGGALGIGSLTGARYITGTARADMLIGTDFNDKLEGLGGGDKIFAGAGTDTVAFSGKSSDYVFASAAGGGLRVTGATGSDQLYGVEIIKFSNGSFSREQLLSSTVPAAPKLNAYKTGYVADNTPLVGGSAGANLTIQLYSGQQLIGVTTSDDKGQWEITAQTLADGRHPLTATATGATGLVSPYSAISTIQVDTKAPVIPTVTGGMSYQGSNQPVYAGTGEVGSFISMYNTVGDVASLIGETVVRADGSWRMDNPLPNGSYHLNWYSTDAAGNWTNSGMEAIFTISSSLNRTLTSGKDLFVNPVGNNAIDGGAGTDTVVFSGLRANYVIDGTGARFTVRSASGEVDTVMNVERLRFDDVSVALDIDGVGGQAYRLFQAAFDRTPLPRGVGFWIDALDKGVTLDQVAAQFVSSPEFVGKFGAQNNRDFITTLFDHVLHRAPAESGFNFWVNALDSGVSRAHVLAQFSEGLENHLNVIGRIENGLDYLLWQG